MGDIFPKDKGREYPGLTAVSTVAFVCAVAGYVAAATTGAWLLFVLIWGTNSSWGTEKSAVAFTVATVAGVFMHGLSAGSEALQDIARNSFKR